MQRPHRSIARHATGPAALLAVMLVGAPAGAADGTIGMAITGMAPDSYYCMFDVEVANNGAEPIDQLGFRIVTYVDGIAAGDTWGGSVSALPPGDAAQVSLRVANIPGVCEPIGAYDIQVTACRIGGGNLPWGQCRSRMDLADDRLAVQAPSP